MLAEIWVATGVVVAVNVAVVCPAATVTVAGTTTAPLVLDNVTTVPPVGATPVRVTVPWDVDPPVTVPGLITTDEGVGPRYVLFSAYKLLSCEPKYRVPSAAMAADADTDPLVGKVQLISPVLPLNA